MSTVYNIKQTISNLQYYWCEIEKNAILTSIYVRGVVSEKISKLCHTVRVRKQILILSGDEKIFASIHR